MNKKNGFLIFGSLALGLFLGFLWASSSVSVISSEPSVVTVQSTAITSESSVVSLMLDYGDGRVRVYPEIRISDNETLLQLLEKQATDAKLSLRIKDFGDLGVLVEEIGGEENGRDGKYWQYWVNNLAIPYGADKYIVKPGDVIEWKFLNYK